MIKRCDKVDKHVTHGPHMAPALQNSAPQTFRFNLKIYYKFNLKLYYLDCHFSLSLASLC